MKPPAPKKKAPAKKPAQKKAKVIIILFRHSLRKKINVKFWQAESDAEENGKSDEETAEEKEAEKETSTAAPSVWFVKYLIIRS